MPAKKLSVTRPYTLDKFMKTVTELKIADDVLKDLIRALNELVTRITKKSAQFATKQERKTIMPPDLEKALDEILRRGPLTVDELLEKTELLTVVQLSRLSEGIKKMAEDLLKLRAAAQRRKKTRRHK